MVDSTACDENGSTDDCNTEIIFCNNNQPKKLTQPIELENICSDMSETGSIYCYPSDEKLDDCNKIYDKCCTDEHKCNVVGSVDLLNNLFRLREFKYVYICCCIKDYESPSMSFFR